MLKTFVANLSKGQKTFIAVLLQTIVIILLITVLNVFLPERTHIKIDGYDSAENSIPGNAKEFIAKNTWNLVQSSVKDIIGSSIDDATIREGTYRETKNEDGSTSVEFILDIDSIKQTYVITTGWSKDKTTTYQVIVNCPSQNEMKYPETICHGMYNSTYSLDLYLPYVVNSPYEDAAPDILIEGNETDKTIRVMLTTCNTDINRQKADQYLQSIPTDLSSYQIIYDVSGADAICSGEL